MKHLVIFYTENGIYSAVYNFKNSTNYRRHKWNAKRYFESKEHRELFDGELKVCQIPSIIGVLDEWNRIEVNNMHDINGNELHIGDKVAYISGKNMCCCLEIGHITNIYQKKNSVAYECSVDGHPHILSSRVLLLNEE